MEEPSLIDIVRSGNVHLLRHTLKLVHIRTSPRLVNEALHEAVRSGQLDCFHALLQGGVDLHALNIHGESLLLTAVGTGKLEIVRDVLRQGYNVDFRVGNSQDTGDMVPMHYAIQLNNPDVLEELLKAGANPNFKDVDGDVAIIGAAMAESLPMVKLLVTNGANINVPGFEGNCALHRATELNCCDILECLLNANPVIDVHNDQGDTPLLLACEMGYCQSTEILLKAGANPGCMNNLNQNSLHFAAMDGNIAILKLLIDKNPDLDVVDSWGNSALILAASLRHEDACLLLLAKGAKVTVVGSAGRMVPHLACLNGMPKLLKEILALSEDAIDCQDDNGDTPAILAIKNEHWDCLELLLKSVPNLDLLDKKSHNCLHWAAINGCPEELFHAILKDGVNLNMTDSEGNVPLSLAAVHGRYPLMQILLQHGCDVNIQSVDGRTALHRVAESGYYDMVWQLLEAKASPDVIDDNGESPLALAIKGKHADIVEEFLGRKVNISIVDNQGRLPLHWACDTDLCDIIRLLLASEGDLDKVDRAGDTSLLIAARKHNKVAVELFAEKQCNLDHIDSQKKSAIFYMAEAGCLDAVKALIEHGAATDQEECAGSPLIQAAKKGHLDIVQVLIDKRAKVDRTDDIGRTAFLWAVGKGHFDVARTLVENGANTRHVDKSGDTPLTLSAWHGHANITEYLLPLSDWEHCENEEGMNALQLSVCQDHKECVRILLEAGYDVSATSRSGNNALILAAIHTSGPDIIAMVLDSGQDLDINFLGEKKRGAVHWSVGDPDSLAVILEKSPQGSLMLDKEDANGATPLLLSIAHYQPQSAALLIKAGCDYTKCHTDGRQPIHHCALYGDVVTLEALLKLGVDPNTTTGEGRTAILIAAIEGHLEIVQLLLTYKCDLNTVFMNAITPLSVAADRKFYEVVEMLLEAGADPDSIGNERHSALMTCTMNEDIYGMCLLLRHNACADQLIDSAENNLLHVAIAKQNVPAVYLLVAAGCNINYIKRVVTNGVLTYFLQNSVALNMLNGVASQPRSLQQLTRLSLRKYLAFPLKPKVNSFNIPAVMKDFLLMKDLEKILDNLSI